MRQTKEVEAIPKWADHSQQVPRRYRQWQSTGTVATAGSHAMTVVRVIDYGCPCDCSRAAADTISTVPMFEYAPKCDILESACDDLHGSLCMY